MRFLEPYFSFLLGSTKFFTLLHFSLRLLSQLGLRGEVAGGSQNSLRAVLDDTRAAKPQESVEVSGERLLSFRIFSAIILCWSRKCLNTTLTWHWERSLVRALNALLLSEGARKNSLIVLRKTAFAYSKEAPVRGI